MDTPFHYKVIVKAIRYNSPDQIDFINVEKEFRDEIPIKAREGAFNFYQNYIDVFLEGKNLTYSTDEQARADLDSYFDPGTKTVLRHDSIKWEWDDKWGNGIVVLVVIDTANIVGYEIGSEWILHGIGYIELHLPDPLNMISGLDIEMGLYKEFGCDHPNTIKLDYHDEEELNSYEIIPTPFDWKKHHEYPDESKGSLAVSNFVKELKNAVTRGEGNQVEFKPCLLYNFKSQKAGISIKYIIAKTICSFLNSNGGLLFIGIKDDGTIQGLENDFSLTNESNPKDFFQKEFDDMIFQFLSIGVVSNIKADFIELEGITIFAVMVYPIFERTIFLKSQGAKEFWIRMQTSSRQIIEIEEIINYWTERYLLNISQKDNNLD